MEELTPPPSNVPEFSVSDLSGALKRTVEDIFSHVRVRGEISGFKRHSSGHLYFALKDADAVLDAVIWRGAAQKLAMAPADGMEVLATGRLTTYPGRSKYQMVIERMELAGQGALLKLLEDRKRKLAAEGLFDQARKRPLPFLPRVIGIVTSPTGAVIRDILHRLRDRFPRPVLLWPVAVQGDGAAQQVAAAIHGFNSLPENGPIARPDLLIVARGGGSVEDLWAFNEEVVVRAAAASAIPLISAVGHETDTTLIDYASDRRAPTPTAAAEMAVPVRADLLAGLADYQARLITVSGRLIQDRRQRLDALARALPNPGRVLEDCTQKLDERAERLSLALPNLLHRRRAELDRLAANLRHPREIMGQSRHRLDQLATRLTHAMTSLKASETARIDRQTLTLAQLAARLGRAQARIVTDKAARLDNVAQLLESVSYHSVLARGYAVVQDDHGRIVQAASAKAGAAWNVQFADGQVAVQVAGQFPPQRSKSKPDPKDGRQGSLL